MLEFENEYPGITKGLIDERDRYMAHMILLVIKKSEKIKKKRKIEIKKYEKDLENMKTRYYISKYTNNLVNNWIIKNNKNQDCLIFENPNIEEEKINIGKMEDIINEEKNITENLNNKILVVVGKAHVDGIINYLNNKEKINYNETIKKLENNDVAKILYFFSFIFLLFLILIIYIKFF
jgi:hypothetical protein